MSTQIQEVDVDKILFRCSSLGYIMQDAKGKSNRQKYDEAFQSLSDGTNEYASLANTNTKTAEKLLAKLGKLSETVDKLEPVKDLPHLSETCKTHLCDVYTAYKYGVHEDVRNKYLSKGVIQEEISIDLYSEYKGIMYRNNKERRKNDYIEGESDIICDYENIVTDIKTNWSIFQFNRLEGKPVNTNHIWQGRGYCWLFDKPRARVAYCLVDTPKKLVAIEHKKLLYDFIGNDEDYKTACDEITKNHTYGHIPISERVREFDIEFTEEHKQKIIDRVTECRRWLKYYFKKSNLINNADDNSEG